MIPDDVRRFILTSIPSVPYLEAVLWLRGHAERAHDAQQIAAALYITDRKAGELLEAARAAAIVEAAGSEPRRYRYRPAPELASMVERLAEVYREDMIGVANLIHDTTQRNAQRFADAFKLRPGR
jgi:hypothetical protein